MLAGLFGAGLFILVASPSRMKWTNPWNSMPGIDNPGVVTLRQHAKMKVLAASPIHYKCWKHSFFQKFRSPLFIAISKNRKRKLTKTVDNGAKFCVFFWGFAIQVYYKLYMARHGPTRDKTFLTSTKITHGFRQKRCSFDKQGRFSVGAPNLVW